MKAFINYSHGNQSLPQKSLLCFEFDSLKKPIEEENTKFVNIWMQKTEDANLGNLNLFASNKAKLKNDDLILMDMTMLWPLDIITCTKISQTVKRRAKSSLLSYQFLDPIPSPPHKNVVSLKGLLETPSWP